MRIKTILLFFLTVLLVHDGISQANFQWADGIWCSVNDVIVDGANKITSCGAINCNSCDLDPGPGTFTTSGTAGYLLKLDQNGSFIDAKVFPVPSSSGAKDVTTDNNGNTYLSFFLYHGIGDFDPGPGTFTLAAPTTEDIVLVKLDPAGNFIWAKQLMGTGAAESTNLEVDGNGDILLTGKIWGTVDFDPSTATYTLFSGNGTSSFIASYAPDGSLLWAEGFFGSGGNNLIANSIDNQGNIVLCGTFQGTVDFDPTNAIDSLTSDSLDVFVCKLSANGGYIYAKKYGGPRNELLSNMALDPNTGDICITGYFSGSPDFDPGPGIYSLTAYGKQDIYVSKLNSSGNFLWAKQMGGQNFDRGIGIGCDINGNIFTTGYFSSICNFNPAASTQTIASQGLEDIYFNMLDSQGNVMWTYSMGSTCYENGTFILPISASELIVTGWFGCNMNFDFNGGAWYMAGHSSFFSDAFIMKVNYTPNGIPDLQKGSSSINLFPNPTNSKMSFSELKDGETMIVELYKSDGEKINEFTITIDNREIDLSKYSNGYYMYKLRSKEGVIKTGKIIKN